MGLLHWQWIALLLISVAFVAYLQVPPTTPKTLSESPKQALRGNDIRIAQHTSLFFQGAKIGYQTIETPDARKERVNFENPTAKTVSGQMIIIVPKEVSPDVLHIHLEGTSATILEDDPILLIPFQLKPGESKSIGFGVKPSQAGIIAVPISDSYSYEQVQQLVKLISPKDKTLYATQDDAAKYAGKVNDIFTKIQKKEFTLEQGKERLKNLAENNDLFVESNQVQGKVQKQVDSFTQKPGQIQVPEGPIDVEVISPLLPWAVVNIPVVIPDLAGLQIQDLQKSLVGTLNGELRDYASTPQFVKLDDGKIYLQTKIDMEKKMVATPDGLKKPDGTSFPGVLWGTIEFASTLNPKEKYGINVLVMVKNARLTTKLMPKGLNDLDYWDLSVEAVQKINGDWLIVNNLYVSQDVCGQRVAANSKFLLRDNQKVNALPEKTKACLTELIKPQVSSCTEMADRVDKMKKEFYDAYSANFPDGADFGGKSAWSVQRLVALEPIGPNQDYPGFDPWKNCQVQGATIDPIEGYALVALNGDFLGEGEFKPVVSITTSEDELA